MLFNSFPFLGLLIVTFTLYYLSQVRSFQITILIIASLVFYAFENPFLLILLITSAVINILTSYYVQKTEVLSLRKAMATAGVIINLLILIFFKYSGLLYKTIWGDSPSFFDFLIRIPLPLGISFFTFEGISLLIDVYRRKEKELKQSKESFTGYFKNIVLFISFFPHLIAGPIVKAHLFLPQITKKYFKDIHWDSVIKYLIAGYFLKMVIADNLKDHTYWIQYPYFESRSSLQLIILLMGYSFQIFADFAGYSLIAVGLAKLFGYNLIDNFNFPYISRSFAEFWNRWHISLSSFLKEYLYIPLGGNRKGKARTYLNLFLVMLLGGLWHGAAWSYAIWGAFHGMVLCLERFFGSYFKLPSNSIINFMKVLFVFFCVTFAWLLFKLPDIRHVLSYIQCMIYNIDYPTNYQEITIIMSYSSFVVAYHILYLIREKVHSSRVSYFEIAAYGSMLFLILTNAGTSGTFIYFQF